MKISRVADPGYMRDLLALLNSELPAQTGLIVDVGFGWPDADTALAEIAQWGDPRLTWLEDPLLPEDAAGCARIRRESGLAVSVGDEVTDPAVLHALVEEGGVDALRLDVVAIGGITPALEMIAWASARQVPVSGHVSRGHARTWASASRRSHADATPTTPRRPSSSAAPRSRVRCARPMPRDSASRSTRPSSPSKGASHDRIRTQRRGDGQRQGHRSGDRRAPDGRRMDRRWARTFARVRDARGGHRRRSRAR
ncbi:enolase C-terminal domain-like protein [Microbacterium sp. Se63.02b]|uniref:enolase C-terminal domain-like protein n=1 Tax=Microbacterium sp. Se63.02b TaxID=2709304 RepID=UPI001FCE50CA|nr:enolase C-terminal domain-like protein [Microbacterium sp. Se63.02b]